jgi:hypothetical protein
VGCKGHKKEGINFPSLVVALELIFEHLIAFFQLPLPGRSAFPFVVSSLAAGTFPTFDPHFNWPHWAIAALTIT